MKTFTKKSLSVVLAMLMALSTLTVGAMSAFAMDFDFTDYTAVSEGVTTITDKTKTKYYFTPASSGYYDISLSAVNNDVSADCDFSIGEIYGDSIDWLDGDDAWSYTTSEVIPVEGKNYMTAQSKTVYLPANVTVKLAAGERYAISTWASSNATAAFLTILKNQSGFSYSYTTTNEELTYFSGYEWIDEETVSDVPVYSTVKLYSPAAVIRGYLGTATTVNVPAMIANLPVKEVYLSAPTALEKRITSVVIPEGVEEIGGMSNFYSLKSINFPSTLKTIEEDAFANCHSLAGVITIPAGVEEIGEYAFYDTGITTVNVLSRETKIGEKAFGYNVVLDEATPDPTDVTFALASEFKILAPADSLAAAYAENNGIAVYDPANCTAGNHYYELVSTPATIFAAGSKVSTCACCGNVVKKKIAKKKFKVSSVKAAKKSITVKSGKFDEVCGYEIQYSTSKKFTKKATQTVKVESAKALSKKITGLKKGKYFVRVRAYKTTDAKTVYSNYSAVKSVKVK